jgi:hypothetical protein
VSTELAALEDFCFPLLKIVKTRELHYILQSKGLIAKTIHDVAFYECNCETVGIKFFVKNKVAFECMCVCVHVCLGVVGLVGCVCKCVYLCVCVYVHIGVFYFNFYYDILILLRGFF